MVYGDLVVVSQQQLTFVCCFLFSSLQLLLFSEVDVFFSSVICLSYLLMASCNSSFFARAKEFRISVLSGEEGFSVVIIQGVFKQ